MDAMHPDMQRALSAIPPGFRHAPVLHATQFLQASNDALRATLATYFAPPCPAGQFAHVHKHPDLGDLECHMEAEPAEPECGWPAQVTLCDAYLLGRRFTHRLTAAEVEVARRSQHDQGEPA